MGLEHRISALLSPTEWPYAAGQGAICLQIRDGDPFTTDIASALDDKETRLRCLAERSLLNTLQGGCSSPVGVYSQVFNTTEYAAESERSGETKPSMVMRLGGSVIHPHGWSEVSCSSDAAIGSAKDAEALGMKVAQDLLASGAGEILSRIHNIELSAISKHMDQTYELDALHSSIHK